MRYQERIYIQYPNYALRNLNFQNIGTSSDLYIFDSPKYTISGATKIKCNSDINLILSGISFSGILTAATATTTTCLTGVTFQNIVTATTWQIKYFENEELTNTEDFYFTLSSDTPTEDFFLTGFTKGLDNLNYVYSQTGSTFEISKKYGVKEFYVDINVLFGLNYIPANCPDGYTATSAYEACKKVETIAVTYLGPTNTIVAGDKSSSKYSIYGAYFYPEISTISNLPVFYIGSNNGLLNQIADTIKPTNINNQNTFWKCFGNVTQGRLNNIGVKPETSYLGFTKCLDIVQSKTYYFGIGAENNCIVRLNGNVILKFDNPAGDNYKKWSVFPIYLYSGKNIIEVLGKDDGFSTASFGFEIYDPESFERLTGATNSEQANPIFSTSDFIGLQWQSGATQGFYCPADYSLEYCDSIYKCSKISVTGFTATNQNIICSGQSTNIVFDEFDYVDANTFGVYKFDNITGNTLNLKFIFTSSTNTFTGANASFKYEIYKFNPNTNIFDLPSVYKSELIQYSTFSATNTLAQSISLSALSLDGDYILKGYYDANKTTSYLTALNKKLDTSIYYQGPEYQLYNSNIDYYFIATTKAQVPNFVQTNNLVFTDDLTVPLYQQVILVDSNETDLYNRTGSTFALQSTYEGDVIVTLNGLVLSPNIDYTISGVVLTMLGIIKNGDILTIVYTRRDDSILTSDSILINNLIPSGPFEFEGTNKYYYNNTKNKYEIYTDVSISENSQIILILNGQTLLQNIDFYQSITNPKRIILEGSLSVGDIITVIYYARTSVIDGIIQKNNIISWNIDVIPQKNNGTFYVEYSKNNDFSLYDTSDVIPYVPEVSNYVGNLSLTGTVGQNYYYRVKNVKEYVSICGDIIKTESYSEVIPVTVLSNAINSY